MFKKSKNYPLRKKKKNFIFLIIIWVNTFRLVNVRSKMVDDNYKVCFREKKNFFSALK